MKRKRVTITQSDIDAAWGEAMKEVRHDIRYPVHMAKTASELGYKSSHNLRNVLQSGNLNSIYYVGKDWRRFTKGFIKCDVFAPVKLKPILDKL